MKFTRYSSIDNAYRTKTTDYYIERRYKEVHVND